jgi:hypothetical protein
MFLQNKLLTEKEQKEKLSVYLNFLIAQISVFKLIIGVGFCNLFFNGLEISVKFSIF